jgi:hypothetical protein
MSIYANASAGTLNYHTKRDAYPETRYDLHAGFLYYSLYSAPYFEPGLLKHISFRPSLCTTSAGMLVQVSESRKSDQQSAMGQHDKTDIVLSDLLQN